MTSFEHLVNIGRITKTFNFDGRLKVSLSKSVDISDSFALFVNIKRDFVPYLIENAIEKKPKEFIVKLEDVDSDEEARNLIMNDVFLSPDDIEFIEDDSNNTGLDLINFELFDGNEKYIGTIVDVNFETLNKVVSVKADEKEYLIPVPDDLIIEIDNENRRIKIDIPEGLLEI